MFFFLIQDHHFAFFTTFIFIFFILSLFYDYWLMYIIYCINLCFFFISNWEHLFSLLIFNIVHAYISYAYRNVHIRYTKLRAKKKSLRIRSALLFWFLLGFCWFNSKTFIPEYYLCIIFEKLSFFNFYVNRVHAQSALYIFMIFIHVFIVTEDECFALLNLVFIYLLIEIYLLLLYVHLLYLHFMKVFSVHLTISD